MSDMDSEDEGVLEAVPMPALPPPALLPDNGAAFPPLESIWKDQYCEACIVKGKSGWKCLRCGYEAIPVHATCAVAHFAKIPKQGVEICSATILDHEYTRYMEF